MSVWLQMVNNDCNYDGNTKRACWIEINSALLRWKEGASVTFEVPLVEQYRPERRRNM